MSFDADKVETTFQNSGAIAPRPGFSTGPHRICQRIQIQVPPQYKQDPIISTLTRYEVEVNIQSALLAYNAQESGWFDLELRGTPERVRQALDYLFTLNIEIQQFS